MLVSDMLNHPGICTAALAKGVDLNGLKDYLVENFGTECNLTADEIILQIETGKKVDIESGLPLWNNFCADPKIMSTFDTYGIVDMYTARVHFLHAVTAPQYSDTRCFSVEDCVKALDMYLSSQPNFRSKVFPHQPKVETLEAATEHCRKSGIYTDGAHKILASLLEILNLTTNDIQPKVSKCFSYDSSAIRVLHTMFEDLYGGALHDIVCVFAYFSKDTLVVQDTIKHILQCEFELI